MGKHFGRLNRILSGQMIKISSYNQKPGGIYRPAYFFIFPSNKTHINTLRWQLKENVFQKKNVRLPFYNIIVTSDCLDINQLNYTHKSQQEDRMYWVRYGKLEEWLKMISQFEDVLSPSDISQIGNYLKIWRYPTEANLQAHIENSKKNNREESNNFFV